MHTRTDIFAGPAELYVDSQNVGWTRGGARLRVNKSMWFRPSMYGLGAEEAIKQSEEFYVSTVLVESTFENLKKAWGINEAITNPNASSDRKRIDFGGSLTVPTHSIRFVARNKTLQVGFYKVVAVDFGEVMYGRTQDAFIPVTFRALIDTTKAVGAQLGYFEQGPYMGESNIAMSLTVRALAGANIKMSVSPIVTGIHHLMATIFVSSSSSSSCRSSSSSSSCRSSSSCKSSSSSRSSSSSSCRSSSSSRSSSCSSSSCRSSSSSSSSS